MTEIPIEARVECVDGLCGKSITVIVNPKTQTVTHLVIQDKSFLEGETRLVPIDQILETTPDLVRLRCTREELAKMEPFVERHYDEEVWQNPAYWYAMDDYLDPYSAPMTPMYMFDEEEKIPEGEIAVRRGTLVEATDGHVGVVGELAVDPASEQVTHLILRQGHLWGKREISLPLSAIDRVEAGTVYLKLDKQAIEQLPSIPFKRQHRKRLDHMPSVELVVKVFDTQAEASEALAFVEDLHRRKIVKILNAAVLAKGEDGATSLEDARDLEPNTGRLLGAVAGGLVGLAAGPVGAIVGAIAGLGAGSLAAKWVDLGFSDEFLTGLQERLQPGSSALVVLVEHDWIQPLSEALAGDDTRQEGDRGVILQQTLTDQMVEDFLRASEETV
jgi:uncharacterized membrane protein